MSKYYNLRNIFAIGILLLLQITFGWTKGIGRIVDGENDSIINVPSLVQIYTNKFFECGGTLLSKSVVLTAAHCVEKLSASQVIVKGGASALLEEGVLANVSEILIPPQWSVKHLFDMDVAMLKLEQPLEGPLIIPTGICTQGGKQGDIVRTYGWGWTKGYSHLPSNQLQSVDLFYVDRPTCKKLWRGRLFITETMICAAAPGKTSCHGDSGGPLYINGKVCGIVSYGNNDCPAAGYPTIYTDLINPEVRAFIKNALQ